MDLEPSIGLVTTIGMVCEGEREGESERVSVCQVSSQSQ